jgi:hypothetical protein
MHKWEPDIYIGFSPAIHLQSSEVPDYDVDVVNGSNDVPASAAGGGT